MIKYDKNFAFKDNISVTSVWVLFFFVMSVTLTENILNLLISYVCACEYVPVCLCKLTQFRNSIVKTTARRAKNSRTGIWIGFFLQRCFRSIRKICYLRLNKRKEKLTTATSHVAKTKVNKRGAMKKISMGIPEQKKTKKVQESSGIV